MENGQTTQPEEVREQSSGEMEELPPVVEAAAPAESADDRFVRLMADFDNFRKRTAKEHLLQRQHGRREAIEKLLTVFDGLTMGLLKMPKDNPYRQGLEVIQQQFVSAFEGLGLKRIRTRGQRFDPQIHEAIGNMPSAEYPEGIICEESRAGFTDEAGLVRAAQVLVSTGAP